MKMWNRLGGKAKKIKITGKTLTISDKNFEKTLQNDAVASFLKDFMRGSSHFTVSTSGSTGKPKAIEIRKEFMETSAQKTIDFLNLREGDRALLCLPTDKIAGIMMMVRWLQGGMDLWPIGPSAKPLEQVEGDFDFAAMVPYQVEASLGQIHRIKKLIIGGGPVNPQLEKQLKERQGAIYHTYGMTETISHVAMRRINGEAASQMYHAMPGVTFDIDERGCLVINASDIGVNNLIANDIVDLIDTYTFRWRGRYDNVVNSGGVKLHPELIEKEIGNLDLPYFLAGIPDPQLGEKLVMVIESSGGRPLGDFEHAFAKLGAYERPRQVLHIAEFSKTDTGKVRRGATLERILGRG